MARIQISYENEMERIKILEALSKGLEIRNITKPYRTGKYTRIYVDVK